MREGIVVTRSSYDGTGTSGVEERMASILEHTRQLEVEKWAILHVDAEVGTETVTQSRSVGNNIPHNVVRVAKLLDDDQLELSRVVKHKAARRPRRRVGVEEHGIKAVKVEFQQVGHHLIVNLRLHG